MLETVYLSLGSNSGDREENLAGALTALSTDDEINLIQVSSYYETEPLGDPEQPMFLNLVVKLETTLEPFDLLDVTQRIEVMLGRPRDHDKNSRRTIDIDILCHGTAYIDTEKLKLPHPGLPFRKFVLVPFKEIAPDFKVPVINMTVNDLLKLCPDESYVTKHSYEKRA